MANTTRKANVIKIDTSAAFTDIRAIRAIKYIGAASGTASIKSDASSSGTLLWEEAGTANVWNQDVCIRDNDGVYVTVASGAVVYLYLE